MDTFALSGAPIDTLGVVLEPVLPDVFELVLPDVLFELVLPDVLLLELLLVEVFPVVLFAVVFNGAPPPPPPEQAARARRQTDDVSRKAFFEISMIFP
jgi:hypothetical protein